MKRSNIPQPLRKDVARLTLAYWEECKIAAARLHPNWEVEGRNVKWLGGRKGPRSPNGLLNWFISNHPDECDRIRNRIAAKHKFAHTNIRDKRPH